MANSATRTWAHTQIHTLVEYEPCENADISIDFVLLHGLGGHWKRTWTANNGYCWLSHNLVPKFPSSRVLCVECPNLLHLLASPAASVEDVIFSLVHNRQRSRRSEKPVVFICHSFGGILLKKIFLATHPSRTEEAEHRQLHESFQAFIYFGTPQKFLSTSNVSALWRALERSCASTLGGHSPDLQNAMINSARINDDFRAFGGEDLPSICLYETLKTSVGVSQEFIVDAAAATLASRPVESIPIELPHQFLCHISSADDNRFAIFFAALDRLRFTITDHNARRIGSANVSSRRQNINILSFDGGGIKGLFSIMVLHRIMEEMTTQRRRIGARNISSRPFDYFDLIGGTSTGGLLAIMLSRLQMDTSACIRTYRLLSQRIFHRYTAIPFLNSFITAATAIAGVPWFSGEQLKSAICDTVEEYVSAREKASMAISNHGPEDVCLCPTVEHQRSRCFVCAVPKDEQTAERIRSYRPIDQSAQDTSTYKIWEAARATSAAPIYFPAISVQGRTYFDGGLKCNNPVIEVIKEARAEFPGARINTVVSIGTGKGRISAPEPYLHNVFISFVERATDTEGKHQEVLNDEAFEDVRPGYFRFQGDFTLGEIDLADAGKLDEIERLATQYLDSRDGTFLVQSCASRLLAARDLSEAED